MYRNAQKRKKTRATKPSKAKRKIAKKKGWKGRRMKQKAKRHRRQT